MIFHIYNPSHEEALSANTPYYYPTLAARSQRLRFGALPALWASPGDAVWVEEDGALPDAPLYSGVRFVTRRELRPSFWEEVERIEPWGWDLLVRHSLRKAGAPERLLPTDEQLATVRRLSSRETVSPVLRARRGAVVGVFARESLASCREVAGIAGWGRGGARLRKVGRFRPRV